MNYKNSEGIVMKFYRLERWCYLHHLKFLAQIIYHGVQLLFGCTIPYSAELEEGVKIAHYHAIVIHHKSKVGAGTVIYQNVSLGGRNGKGGPIIGMNCVIGAGACLLGEIIIGNNVNIGANAVVLEGVHLYEGSVVGAGAVVIKDVLKNQTVVGVPAKVIKENTVWELNEELR